MGDQPVRGGCVKPGDDFIRICEYPYIFFPSNYFNMFTPPEVFKSLADETRSRATLLIASQGELCVCELMFALEESQPKISRHLAQLRSSGLLLDRRQGQWVYYRLNPHLPAWVSEVLQLTLDANAQWLQHNAHRLLNMEGRPLREVLCC
jgi:ArsR family transcriptional regulator